MEDLASTHPELIKEWDFEKNSISPYEVSAGMARIVWWICPLGHSYDMRIISRAGKQKCGCPYCSVPAKRLLKGFNDFQTKYPLLAKEWHPVKNGKLTPDSVMSGSAKKVWWLGRCGHEFEQPIVKRVYGGGCPYCSHQKLLKGFNDFATTNPEMLAEWDYSKNDVQPTEIGIGTHRKIWWKCPFGHSYQAYPSNRCGYAHSGCTICDKENHTSFPEQALYYYVKKYFSDAVNSDRTALGMELDILIPSLRVAIEYDGRNWHKHNRFECKKNIVCKEKNIRLIRIREEGLSLYDDCFCIVRNDLRSNESLSKVIKQVLLEIQPMIETDIDVDRDSSEIYNSYILTRKSQSLQRLYPEIAVEWHPIKNGNLTAEMVAPKSNKKVWWFGKCGHEWQSPIVSRTNMNCGCPVCSGKMIVSGVNDLLSQYPELCEEWFYERNDASGLFPNQIAPHSDKKAWWKCQKCGFIWKAKIDGRTGMKAGCPKCGKDLISESKYKPVRCIETGIKYSSLQEAEKKTGINKSCISNCCRGVQNTAGKLHWEFFKE